MRKETPIGPFNCTRPESGAGGTFDGDVACARGPQHRAPAGRRGGALPAARRPGAGHRARRQLDARRRPVDRPSRLAERAARARRCRATTALYYSKYGLLLPLLSVIPVAIVQPIGAVTGRVDLLEAAAAASLMPLITGALARGALPSRPPARRAAPCRRARRGGHRARHVPAAVRPRLLHRAARRARARRHGRARARRPRARGRRRASVRGARASAVGGLRAVLLGLHRAASGRRPAHRGARSAALAPSCAPRRRSRSPPRSPIAYNLVRLRRRAAVRLQAARRPRLHDAAAHGRRAGCCSRPRSRSLLFAPALVLVAVRARRAVARGGARPRCCSRRSSRGASCSPRPGSRGWAAGAGARGSSSRGSPCCS